MAFQITGIKRRNAQSNKLQRLIQVKLPIKGSKLYGKKMTLEKFYELVTRRKQLGKT